MSMGNRTFNEHYRCDAITPALVDDNTKSTGWIRVVGQRIVGLVLVGATDITVDAKLRQAQDDSGTNAKDITGAAVTQFSGTDDNKWASIDVDAARLDVNGNFTHVELLITVGDGTTGANVAGVLLQEVRHKPPVQPAAYKEAVHVV